MREEERMYLHWFCFHAQISYQKKRFLCRLSIPPKRLFYMEAGACRAYFQETEMASFLKSRELETTKREIAWLHRNNGWTVFWNEERYPEKLKQIYDYPLGLYGIGRLPKEEQLSIAMVGARDATPYGIQAAQYFAKELAAQKIAIISGLARGIDGESHRAALMAKGYTMGVLGCGLDVVYPKSNGYLYEQMKEQGGIVTEYPLGRQPLARNFPLRNRIISGLSDGVFVIEAKKKSGSLITADLALDQGKEVFALSGRYYDVLSSGCMDLIQKGAKLVYSPKDIMEEFALLRQNFVKFISNKKIPLAKNEKLVYDCLRLEPRHVNEIANEAQLPMSEVLSILTVLEMEQYIRQVDKNYYRMND